MVANEVPSAGNILARVVVLGELVSPATWRVAERPTRVPRPLRYSGPLRCPVSTRYIKMSRVGRSSHSDADRRGATLGLELAIIGKNHQHRGRANQHFDADSEAPLASQTTGPRPCLHILLCSRYWRWRWRGRGREGFVPITTPERQISRAYCANAAAFRVD
jgi:hypothetical protein